MWVRQEADTGRRRDLLTSEEREELKRLRKGNAELPPANTIMKDASVYWGRSSSRPGKGGALVEERRNAFGSSRSAGDRRTAE